MNTIDGGKGTAVAEGGVSTPEAPLVEKLRGTASTGYDEWRVQDPKTGAYCIGFQWPDDSDPEHQARRWLETEKVKYPNGRFSQYVVACVRVVPLKDRLLSEAAAAIERLTARAVFAENDAATLRMLVERLTADHSALLDTCRLQTAEVRGLSEQVAELTTERDALASLVQEFVDFLEPMRFDRPKDDARAVDLDKKARATLAQGKEPSNG